MTYRAVVNSGAIADECLKTLKSITDKNKGAKPGSIDDTFYIGIPDYDGMSYEEAIIASERFDG